MDIRLTRFRYNVPIQINTNDKVKNRVNGSVEFLKQHLENGEVVYGKRYSLAPRMNGRLTWLSRHQHRIRWQRRHAKQ